jgi:hypothetical protein
LEYALRKVFATIRFRHWISHWTPRAYGPALAHPTPYTLHPTPYTLHPLIGVGFRGWPLGAEPLHFRVCDLRILYTPEPYRGASLTRTPPPLGPYRRTMPRALRWPLRFRVSALGVGR